jgi:hypothetical protein
MHPLQLYFSDQFQGFGLNLAIQPKPILIWNNLNIEWSYK